MKEFKPMTLGSIFDNTLKVSFNRDSLKLLGLYIAACAAPLIVLASKVQTGLFRSIYASIDPGRFRTQAGDPLLELLVVLGLLFIVGLLTILYTLMATDLFSHRFLQAPYKITRSLRVQAGRIPRCLLYLLLIGIAYGILLVIQMLLSAVLIGIAGMLFSVLVIIMGLFVALFSFAVIVAVSVFIRAAVPAMVIENRGALRCFLRSFKLVTKNFWSILGVTLLYHLILIVGSYLLLIILTFPISLIMMALNSQVEEVLPVILSVYMALYFLMIVLNLFLTNSVNVIIFYNQKIKREGFGAELLAEQFIENAQKAEA